MPGRRVASYYRARERSDADHYLPRRWAQSGRQARPVLPNREAGLDCEQRERNSGTSVVNEVQNGYRNYFYMKTILHKRNVIFVLFIL